MQEGAREVLRSLVVLPHSSFGHLRGLVLLSRCKFRLLPNCCTQAYLGWPWAVSKKCKRCLQDGQRRCYCTNQPPEIQVKVLLSSEALPNSVLTPQAGQGSEQPGRVEGRADLFLSHTQEGTRGSLGCSQEFAFFRDVSGGYTVKKPRNGCFCFAFISEFWRSSNALGKIQINANLISQ